MNARVKKPEEKKHKPPCEHCKRWDHMLDQCWRKNPEIAPPKWREKAEGLRKKEEDRKKYVDTMDFNASLAFAAASKEEKRLARSKPLGPAMREWEEGRRE